LPCRDETGLDARTLGQILGPRRDEKQEKFLFFCDGLRDEPEVMPCKEGASSRSSARIAAFAQYDVQQ
jgi:hypothetical protein